MERYLQIGKKNLRFNMPIHIIVTLVVLVLSPLVLGMKNLDASQTARILEFYVVLIGIVLLPPIFLPEQNIDIRDLVRSKYTSQAVIYAIRIFQALIVLAASVFVYIFVLKQGNCVFPAMKYYFGTIAGILFLGGLGTAVYSFSDNVIVGYMIPIVYYMLNYGGGEKYVGRFYLFSMMKGSFMEKIYLAAGGVILLAAGVLYRSFVRK